jgi:hypothetical protein
MKVTRHFCDFCGAEMMDKYEMKAHLVRQPRGDGVCGYKDRDFSGEFCSIRCAGGFVARDGKKEEPKPMATEEYNSLQQASCHPNHVAR